MSTCKPNTPTHYPCCQPTTDDVIVQFVRSSGAGGQNVNKVSTKVDMRFNVRKTDWLEDDVKEAVERMVCVCVCVGVGWGWGWGWVGSARGCVWMVGWLVESIHKMCMSVCWCTVHRNYMHHPHRSAIASTNLVSWLYRHSAHDHKRMLGWCAAL